MDVSEISYNMEILFKVADTTVTISNLLDMRIFFKYMVKRTMFEESLRKLVDSLQILDNIGRMLLFERDKSLEWMQVKRNNSNEILWKEKCFQNVMLIYGYKMTDKHFEYSPFHTIPVYKIESMLLEISLLRIEIRLLLDEKHPKQEAMIRSVHSWISDENNELSCRSFDICFVCNFKTDNIYLCEECNNDRFCKSCMLLFHRHPDRINHRLFKEINTISKRDISSQKKGVAVKTESEENQAMSHNQKLNITVKAESSRTSSKFYSLPKMSFATTNGYSFPLNISQIDAPTNKENNFQHDSNFSLLLDSKKRNNNDLVVVRQNDVTSTERLLTRLKKLDQLSKYELNFLTAAMIASSDLEIDENVYENYLRLKDQQETSFNYLHRLREDIEIQYINNKSKEISLSTMNEKTEAFEDAESFIEKCMLTENEFDMQLCCDSIWKHSHLNAVVFAEINDRYLSNICNDTVLPLEQRALALHCEFDLPFTALKHFLLAYEVLQEKPILDIKTIKECLYQNTTFDNIVLYLNHSCPSCHGIFTASKMINMVACGCEICVDCFVAGYSIKIQEMSCSLAAFQCLLCDQPKNLIYGSTDEVITFHLQWLTNLINRHIPDLAEKFSERLLSLSLKENDHFMWCQHCANGFFIEEDSSVPYVECDQCKNKSCSRCKCKWEEQHENISCEQFLEWKIANDPFSQEQRLGKYLELHGIVCPRCKRKFELAKGGCMHFTCSVCKCEFCSGCKQLMYRGKCDKPYCMISSGLHAHHPRNCLYYLRDLDVCKLQSLLKANNIKYEEEIKQLFDNSTRSTERVCCVMIQKAVGKGFKDEICGKASFNDDLCIFHYKEYLTMLININRIDPVTIYDVPQLKLILEREGIPHNLETKNELIELITKHIELKT